VGFPVSPDDGLRVDCVVLRVEAWRWTWNAQRGRASYFPRACLHLEYGYFRADLIRTVWIILLGKRNAVVQTVSSRLYIAEPRVRSKASVCDVCGGQSAAGTGFSPNTSVGPPPHGNIRPLCHTCHSLTTLLCLSMSIFSSSRVLLLSISKVIYRVTLRNICLLTPSFLQYTFLMLVLSSTVIMKYSS
jgi:hypothetical protein